MYFYCTGSKETAFIYAITSAGVVYSITNACSSGRLTECSCDSMQHGQTTPEGWKWGGCRYIILKFNNVINIIFMPTY